MAAKKTAKKRVHNKSTGRDYTYDKAYRKKPAQLKNNAKRKAARRKLEKAGVVRKNDGKDVDHVKPMKNGGGNGRKNLRAISKSKNRARK